MTVEVGPIISFLAQRIVLAPSQVDPPSPLARGTPVKRFREGLLTEATFRAEMAALGWSPTDIDRSLVQARLERAFDDFQDRLAALEDAYNKDIITLAELQVQLLALIPDQAKALVVLDRMDFAKRPKPKPLAAPEVPTLTVGRLLAAFKAGVLAEPGLRSELAERGYEPVDIDIMLATEAARLPKPKAPALRQLSLGDLRAMLATGILTPEEFRAELLGRGYSPEDADNLLALELSRIMARAA